MEDYSNNPGVLDALMACGGRPGMINLLRILQEAESQVHDGADPDSVDDDWYTNFSDKARLCSDEEFSKLWASLLAGQINRPGSYSRKTVNILGDMDTRDAAMFQKLCQFDVILCDPQTNKQRRFPIIINTNHDIYIENGVTEESLKVLNSLTLIQYSLLPQPPPRENIFAHSAGWLLNYSPKATINLGNVSYTYSGEQLSLLCVPWVSPEGYWQYLKEHWEQKEAKINIHPGSRVAFSGGQSYLVVPAERKIV